MFVDLEHRGDRPLQKRPVVGDRHHAYGQPLEKTLETVEPVEVQVVGRLVEQEHVELRQQDSGHRRPRCFASRQRGRLLVEKSGPEPQLGPEGSDPALQVGASKGHPALERLCVPQVILRLPAGHGRGGGIQVGVGRPDPGATDQEVAHRLTGMSLGLLGQIAHRRRRGRQHHRSCLQRLETGEGAQQCRLARAIGRHHADTAAGRDSETDSIENELVTEGDGEIAGDEDSGHVPRMP